MCWARCWRRSSIGRRRRRRRGQRLVAPARGDPAFGAGAGSPAPFRTARPPRSPRGSSCAGSTGHGRARSPSRRTRSGRSGSTCAAASATASSTPPRPLRWRRRSPRACRRSRSTESAPRSQAVEPVAERVGSGPRVGMLPDLVVRWSTRPSRRGEVLTSPQFGTVRRDGVGSGRSGNHNDDAWALVLPAAGAGPHEAERDLGDIAATALSRFGLESAGRTLIEAR